MIIYIYVCVCVRMCAHLWTYIGSYMCSYVGPYMENCCYFDKPHATQIVEVVSVPGAPMAD